MKMPTIGLLLIFPFCAFAQEAAPLQTIQESGIQVIDGKKFFPLNGARRQFSTTPTPSALAVINHPRVDPRISPANRARMTPVAIGKNPTPPSSPDDDILSVFAPEDRGLKSLPPNSSSPYRK